MFPDWAAGVKKLMSTFQKPENDPHKLWEHILNVHTQLNIFVPQWHMRHSHEANDTWIAIHRLEHLVAKMSPFMPAELHERILEFHDLANDTFKSMLEWSDIEMRMFEPDGAGGMIRVKPLDYEPPERTTFEKKVNLAKEQLDQCQTAIRGKIRQLSGVE